MTVQDTAVLVDRDGNPVEIPDLLRDVLRRWGTPPDDMVGKLPRARSKDNKRKGRCLPRSQGGNAPDDQDTFCGGWHDLPAVHLDYLGHAAVTRVLIEIDPLWSWEPVAFDEQGCPLIQVRGNGQRLVLWGRLTLLGVSRLCCGTCEASKHEPEKELIGDLLRNGAMRFGIGLSLWSKEEWETAADAAAVSQPAAVEHTQAEPAADQQPTVAEQRAEQRRARGREHAQAAREALHGGSATTPADVSGSPDTAQPGGSGDEHPFDALLPLVDDKPVKARSTILRAAAEIAREKGLQMSIGWEDLREGPIHDELVDRFDELCGVQA